MIFAKPLCFPDPENAVQSLYRLAEAKALAACNTQEVRAARLALRADVHAQLRACVEAEAKARGH